MNQYVTGAVIKKLLFYCNRDGLFSMKVIKGIDDRQVSYDDVEERRALEETALQSARAQSMRQDAHFFSFMNKKEQI